MEFDLTLNFAHKIANDVFLEFEVVDEMVLVDGDVVRTSRHGALHLLTTDQLQDCLPFVRVSAVRILDLKRKLKFFLIKAPQLWK